jgi:hypothetical protein
VGKARRLPLEWNSLRGSTLLGEEGEKMSHLWFLLILIIYPGLGANLEHLWFFSFIFYPFTFEQGSLTEGEGSVQLTSFY